MRCFLAGLAILVLTSLSFAQPRGEIESIGFSGQFRSDCWTPMVVRLVPGSTQAGTYQLQVKQFDQDGDRPIFTRTITLNAEDQSSQQRFWMYFLPEPINEGLPSGSGALRDLQRRLKVVLTSADGKKPIADLPATSTIFPVDPFLHAADSASRGKRLILCVTDGTSQPAWPEYLDREGVENPNVVGYVEGARLVSLKPSELPDNVLGYEAVDGIVWLNADPAELQRGGENKLQTLRDYIKSGGRFVISFSGNDWQRSLGFGDLLPVSPTAGKDKANLFPLRNLAGSFRDRGDDPWTKFKGPFRLVRAEAKVGSVVDEWIEWSKDGKDRSPYLVRRGLGLGSVTWVAQDLGDPALTAKATPGWALIWDKIFDWKNDTKIRGAFAIEADWNRAKAPYDRNSGSVDLGRSLEDITLTSKTVVYVSITLFFFVIYWIVAGPGGFVFLAAKKRSNLSWPAFCITAILATLITALLVKILVRGAPELKHLSIVRIAPNQPAVVHTRFGLYIPEDGERTIELKDASTESVSAMTALAVHPNYASTPDYKPATEYTIAVRESGAGESPEYRVPYRSTLKKFSARWSGNITGGIVCTAKLDPENGYAQLSGRLTNTMELDLSDVYIAFKPQNGFNKEDWAIYLPSLKKGETIDFSKDLNSKTTYPINPEKRYVPGEGKIISDRIASAGSGETGWDLYWYGPMRNNNPTDRFNDSMDGYSRSLPLLSLFDRLPPSRYSSQTGRFDLLRRNGGRLFNMSQCLSAGQLVVLAHAKGPIPFPLEVQGSKVDGTGTTFYEFVLPLDRSVLDLPTTQPVEK